MLPRYFPCTIPVDNEQQTSLESQQTFYERGKQDVHQGHVRSFIIQLLDIPEEEKM